MVRAKPGQERELGRRMAALLDPTRAEPGCIAYDLFQSTEDPAVWVLLERWRSAADLDAHVVTDHFAGFLARSDEVLDRPPDNFRLRRWPPDDLRVVS
ncbi:putative quinol monooxygenase [Mesorhizobium sp.]|uniref:putative quinol monooxygenase n=1 Tax=Mesorhizobium sp. TaxID=1871066 RepID=UPI00258C7E76|nr:putative quinol monooxygenase [Mesorhizobium sp.]